MPEEFLEANGGDLAGVLVFEFARLLTTGRAEERVKVAVLVEADTFGLVTRRTLRVGVRLQTH